jgi:hypothetical protein
VTDRAHDTSKALTEVRTVLSRAESAIDRLGYLVEMRTVDPQFLPGDPYEDDMIKALDSVVFLLDRWRRAGKKPRNRP